MLSEFIEAFEASLNKKAIRELLPKQPGDVPSTFADVSLIASTVGYRPQVTMRGRRALRAVVSRVHRWIELIASRPLLFQAASCPCHRKLGNSQQQVRSWCERTRSESFKNELAR